MKDGSSGRIENDQREDEPVVEDKNYPERRLLQLQLRNIQIEEVGFASAPYWLHTKLVHPRPGIPDEKVTVELDESLEELKEGVSYENKPLHKRLLMKEIVEGPFSLVVMLSETKGDDIPNSLIKVVRQTSKEVGKRVIGGLTVRTIHAYIDFIEDLVMSQVNGGSSIALGYVEMNTTETDRSLIEAELKAVRDLYNPTVDRGPDRETTVLSEGENYGEVIKSEEEPKLLKQTGDENGQVTFDAWIVDR